MKIRSSAPEIDIEFTLKTLHKPGILGNVFVEMGSIGALIGDVSTIQIGKSHAVRKVIISVYDEEHLKEVFDKLGSHEHVEVLGHTDMVFERHRDGKIHSRRNRDIKTVSDLRYVYTPGVARICEEIHKNPQKAREYTSIGNSIGVFTNGTRVLGLGDIGPEASMPVMEGKAMIYDQFVGLSATPVLIETKDAEEFVKTVVQVSPTFGAIHLEDIRVPDCFYIEDELKKRIKKPIMHDDQHGTATVTLAAVISILRILKRKKDGLSIAQIGLGAAGFGIASLLHNWGAKVTGVDPSPAAQKRFLDHGGQIGELEEAVKNSEVVITTTGVVGLITPQMIQKGHAILSLSNPQPEIKPEEALEAGASFAADGKSINNALAYPGLFKAALKNNAHEISSEMKITAAEIISRLSDADELVPSPFHPTVHSEVIDAITQKT